MTNTLFDKKRLPLNIFAKELLKGKDGKISSKVFRKLFKSIVTDIAKELPPC